MTIIPLTGDTESILEPFLYQALYVAPGAEPFPLEIVQEPHIRKYIQNIDQKKEFGFLAVIDNQYVGAIWGRYLSEEHPGYGYYRADYPEITLSVLSDHQKQGIGTQLLYAFMAEARERKLRGISLSVSYGNYAMKLYESVGFQVLAERENDILMAVELDAFVPQKDLEIEVKVKVDHEKVIGCLEKLGFQRCSKVYERDVYYNSEVQDLKKADKALRIREYRDLDRGETSFILNFKGPKLDDSTMTREETEFEIPSFESGERLFHGLGFFAAGTVEKTRTHYAKEEVSCCLDQVTGLGEFLEIEILAPETAYEVSIQKIESLLEQLGLSMKDTIRHSYLSMVMKGVY